MCSKSVLNVCITIAALDSNVPIPGWRFRSTYKWLIVFTLRNNSVGKESTCNAGDPGSIPGSERSAGEGIGYPLQYSWASLVAQLVKNPPAMWETWVWTWVEKILWRRERLPTAVIWPGEFHGLYSPWGCKELDMSERLSLHSDILLFTHCVNSEHRWDWESNRTNGRPFRREITNEIMKQYWTG